MQAATIGYSTHSGLGHLARDFYRHGIISRILIVPHRSYATHDQWYPPEARFSHKTTDEFLDGLDVLLLFENAWYWDVAAKARERGVKIVLIPNYEYTPYPPNVPPDLFLCASLLDVDIYSAAGWPTKFIPIPVEREWRLRERACEFVHNCGHGQHDWAKGTPLLLEAMEHVKSPVKLLVRGQPGEQRVKTLFAQHRNHPRVEFVYADVPDEELYVRGDVFINAEQFNGMSLPLQEAYASGLMVMTTNRYPANTWLPTEPLIPVAGYRKYRIPGGAALDFDRAVVEPRDIAATIDRFYDTDISAFSRQGCEWAEANSWSELGPRYMATLEAVR